MVGYSGLQVWPVQRTDFPSPRVNDGFLRGTPDRPYLPPSYFPSFLSLRTKLSVYLLLLSVLISIYFSLSYSLVKSLTITLLTLNSHKICEGNNMPTGCF